MPASALVDSSFFIDRLRSGVDPFEELAAHANDWDFATCGVITIEVLRGIRHKGAHERVARLFGSMIYLPTINSIWENATALAGQLDRRGRSMQVTDLIIACSALHADAAVLTFDNDFRAVPHLRVLSQLS